MKIQGEDRNFMLRVVVIFTANNPTLSHLSVINFHFPLRCSNTLYVHVLIAFPESYIVAQNLQATIAFRSFPLKSNAIACFQCRQITWRTWSFCVYTSSQLRISFVRKIIFFPFEITSAYLNCIYLNGS